MLWSTFSFGQDFTKKDSILYRKTLAEMRGRKSDDKINALKGQEFPGFVLSDIDGYTVDSRSLRGRVTLINFWDSNCQSCLNIMIPLNELQEKYYNQVNFISMTTDPEKEIRDLLAVKKFNFKHVLAPISYMQNFGAFLQPKTFLIDQDFKVVEIFSQMYMIDKDFRNTQKEYRETLAKSIDLLLN